MRVLDVLLLGFWGAMGLGLPQNRLEPVLFKNEAVGVCPIKSNHFPRTKPKKILSVPLGLMAYKINLCK